MRSARNSTARYATLCKDIRAVNRSLFLIQAVIDELANNPDDLAYEEQLVAQAKRTMMRLAVTGFSN